MFKIVLQSLLARKRRLVTTALAVIIGVAFTAGTLMLTDTMSKIFNDLSADVYKGTNAVVRAKAVFTNMGTGERPNIDASLVPALSHVPGVAAAEGSAFGYTRLIGKDGTPIGNPGGRRAHPGRQLEHGPGPQPVPAGGRACPAGPR